MTAREGAHAVDGLVPGCPQCAENRKGSGSEDDTAKGAGVNGLKCYSCRDQLYEKDGKSRGNCSDKYHPSGLAVVYLYGQKASLHRSFWTHLIKAGRTPGVGAPSIPAKAPVTRLRKHPVLTTCGDNSCAGWCAARPCHEAREQKKIWCCEV